MFGAASQFAAPVQLERASGNGKNEKRWLTTERHLDHGGLELYLRDVEPRPWARNILRDLIAFLVAEQGGAKISITLDPKLDSEQRIRVRLRRLGVRTWPG